jgi:hypothetical protein
MEGEQLPKATMNSFIKSHTNMHYSAEFITKMLSLSRGHYSVNQLLLLDYQTRPIKCVKKITRRPLVHNIFRKLFW